MNYLQTAQNERDYLVKMRRHFHSHPEVSWDEHETQKTVMAELDKMGIPYVPFLKLGVVATIEGKCQEPVLAIRADMDALPLTEISSCEYASKNPGVMHACGHDAHTAILLGVAKVLNEHKDELNCTVKLIFQPAEEITMGGGKLFEQEGGLDYDTVIALHVWSGYETGYITVDAGPRMASTDSFIINVHGKGGHGSEPQTTVDPLYVGTLIVQGLQGIITRQKAAIDPAVISVCAFNSGTAFNIIPQDATIMGTVRTFNNDVRYAIDKSIRRIAKGIAESYGATVDIEYGYGTDPVINDAKAAAFGQECVKMALGEQALIHTDMTMGGEDFCFFLNKAPGCLAFVGCGNAEKGITAPHHNERFDIDEESLVNGLAYFLAYALNYK